MNNLHFSEEAQNDLLEIKTYIEEELLNPSRSLSNCKSNHKESSHFTESCADRSTIIFDCRYRERLSYYCKWELHQFLSCL